MDKASFFSESKCRTNGKEIMVLYLHKFEPPQIMQPSFTTLRASTYTPPSLFSPRFPLCPQHLIEFQMLQKSPSYCQKLLPPPPPLPTQKLHREDGVQYGALHGLMVFMRAAKEPPHKSGC